MKNKRGVCGKGSTRTKCQHWYLGIILKSNNLGNGTFILLCNCEEFLKKSVKPNSWCVSNGKIIFKYAVKIEMLFILKGNQ